MKRLAVIALLVFALLLLADLRKGIAQTESTKSVGEMSAELDEKEFAKQWQEVKAKYPLVAIRYLTMQAFVAQTVRISLGEAGKISPDVQMQIALCRQTEAKILVPNADLFNRLMSRCRDSRIPTEGCGRYLDCRNRPPGPQPEGRDDCMNKVSACIENESRIPVAQ